MIRLRPRRMTVRLKLTALFTGLFLAAGVALLGLTYVLFQQAMPRYDANKVLARFQVSKGDVFGLSAPTALTPDLLAKATQAGVPQKVVQFGNEIRDNALTSMLTQSGIAFGLVALATVGLGWVVAGRVLRPLHQITETARRVADRSLHERIALQGPQDELTELADTFDAMLARLDRAFQGQRRFVGNAAHELRTPLAINRTLLEVALTRPDVSDDLRHLGTTLLAVNERHRLLIDGLLLLARSDVEVESPVPIDLAELVANVAADHRAPSSTVDVRLNTKPARVSGDPVLLERLVGNLVDNAIRYNRAGGGWVELSTATRSGSAELTVVNTGRPVAEYDVPRLFEPFRRGVGRTGASGASEAADRVGSARGIGLGLSIVRSIAVAHGGSVSARPHEGGGLEVRVRLPRTYASGRTDETDSGMMPLDDQRAILRS